eukprot:scaffold157851_cov33-Tisochrysis_lutea.AAC.5
MDESRRSGDGERTPQQPRFQRLHRSRSAPLARHWLRARPHLPGHLPSHWEARFLTVGMTGKAMTR